MAEESYWRRVLRYGWLLDPRKRAPEKKFVVFGQSRSGSTLLTDLLNSHPEVHCDKEIFLRPVPHATLYRKALERRSPKPVYGFKTHIHQLHYKLELADPAAFMRALRDDGYQVVFLRRRQLLRQVVSDGLRRAGGATHHKDSDGEVKLSRLRLDPAEVLADLKLRDDFWQEAEEVLEGIPYHTVEYERDLSDPARHQPTMDRLFAFLGVEPVPVATRLRRINTRTLPDLIENYDELAAALRGTAFEGLLEEGAASPP